ncbi:MAG: hypothetical protein GY854_09980 [Deltaproteobacteria bacterium]|nr:hypothetical protein [Deltaproteobacteria bacterium]
MVATLAWLTAILVVGTLLTLERRCLGQMAVVQPLVVCLLAGLLSGIEETGIWMGISLQLFSVTQFRQIDWSFSGVVSAAALLAAVKLGIPLTVGGPGAYTVMIAGVLTGFGSRALDRRYARIDGERQRSHSPWASDDPARTIESMVRGVIARWLVIGVFQVVVGTGLILVALLGVGQLCNLGHSSSTICAAAVPTLGAAIAISSLKGGRFLAIACACAAASFALVLI